MNVLRAVEERRYDISESFNEAKRRSTVLSRVSMGL